MLQASSFTKGMGSLGTALSLFLCLVLLDSPGNLQPGQSSSNRSIGSKLDLQARVFHGHEITFKRIKGINIPC